ncbi:hypothetical protein V4F39_03790 [Aquincola sp. MAHUQ-54]|uniref:Uncharacterized protein n=2 Tax=Sphaerotilaceae TaxID=2975441 RepID=A0AAW9Q247_9BURK
MPAHPMLKAFYETKSGRAFVQYAMQHPERGGMFYSRAFLRQCGLVRAQDDQLQHLQAATEQEHDGHTHRRRVEALRFLRDKCTDFTSAELSGADFPATLVDQDSLEASSASFYKETQNKNIEAARLAIKSILGLADPVQLDQIGVRILTPGLQSTKTFHFDGHQYPVASEVVHTAAYLLPCELGLACSLENDLALALQCATGQTCFQTRQDRALAEMASGSEDTYENAKRLSKQMANAIRSGNVDAFIPAAK